MSKPIGAASLALIQRFEGCRLKAYKPVKTEKYWTISWGHYGPDVQEGQTITRAEADAMLKADCQRFSDAVDNPAYCPLTAQLNANQRDTLVSFTFNCGAGCLKTFCKGRSLPQVCVAMAKYNLSGRQAPGGSGAPQSGRAGAFQYTCRGGRNRDLQIPEGRAGEGPIHH